MKTVCVYHSIDLDGWVSASIVKHWWKSLYYDVNNVYDTEEDGSLLLRGNFSNEEQERLDFIGYNYGQPIPDLSEYDKIIMCDISFPEEEMFKIYMQKEYGNFIWLDHHISAINISLERDYEDTPGDRDTNFAACELTWKYFFPKETMPEIVRLLGRYDCFGHKGTDEEIKVLEFQYGARQCISNYEEAYNWLYDCIRQEMLGALENYIWQKGKAIYSYLCTEAKQAYSNGFAISLPNITIPEEEYVFLCINKERFNPINFGIDYHKDGYDGAACFHYANGMWNFSIYNDNGLVDCSVIAKQFGGGGHFSASGMVVNTETMLKIING